MKRYAFVIVSAINSEKLFPLYWINSILFEWFYEAIVSIQENNKRAESSWINVRPVYFCRWSPLHCVDDWNNLIFIDRVKNSCA